jgi:hypothetical protein
MLSQFFPMLPMIEKLMDLINQLVEIRFFLKHSHNRSSPDG